MRMVRDLCANRFRITRTPPQVCVFWTIAAIKWITINCICAHTHVCVGCKKNVPRNCNRSFGHVYFVSSHSIPDRNYPRIVLIHISSLQSTSMSLLARRKLLRTEKKLNKLRIIFQQWCFLLRGIIVPFIIPIWIPRSRKKSPTEGWNIRGKKSLNKNVFFLVILTFLLLWVK